MKYFSLITSISTIQALSIPRIQQTIDFLEADFFQQNPDIDITTPFGPGLRNGGGQTFSEAIIDITSGIKDYGCYCHFGETIIETKTGKGEAIDAFDGFCKSLYHAYKCLVIDDTENSCQQPELEFSEIYDISFQIPSRDRLQDSCIIDSLNPDNGLCGTYSITNLYKGCNHEQTEVEGSTGISTSFNCSTSACLSDMTFAGSWWTLMMDEFLRAGPNSMLTLLDPEHYHENGFDLQQSCVKKASHIVMNQACCGEYPYRFPFGQENDRECCVDKTYNSKFLQCCADGSLNMVC